MTSKLTHTFYPGDNWLYFKVYCGQNTADKLLINSISPLVIELLNNEVVTKWFFIRYTDPDNHLRIRFLLKNPDSIGYLIQEFRTRCMSFIESKEIWSIQIDTYKREVQRYGINTIELVESFFFSDSEFVLHLIGQTNSDIQRVFFLLDYINKIFGFFNLTTKQKILFSENQRNLFKKELSANKQTIKIITKKYKELKLIDSTNLNHNIVNQKNIISELIKFKEVNNNKENLLGSLIHMSINRCFINNQRLYEFVIYDFLLKLNLYHLNVKENYENN